MVCVRVYVCARALTAGSRLRGCVLHTQNAHAGGGSSTKTPASQLRNQSTDLAAGDWLNDSLINRSNNQSNKEMGSALDRDKCFLHKY